LSVIKQSRWLFVVFITLFTSMAFGHGMSEAEKQIITEGGNLSYVWIGATHMLSGYDHLAFVFGIIFFLTKFKDIVKYISAFTLGHSITLILATFNGVQINYFLIDAVIALSVCYIAFQNLDGFKKHFNIKAPNMLAMIFGLGLIHGLGLSTRLQQLPLNQNELLMNIVSFNVGIEFGQISALALMLLVIAAFRKSHFFPLFSKVSNYLLVMAGVLLFLMQMHSYEHAANASEYSVNSKTAVPEKLEPSSQMVWQDTIKVVIPARGEKEYKLQLEQGASFKYSWQSDNGPLFFDFHGEPSGKPSGYFKSFEKGTKSNAVGALTTVFAGTHGWYWKNSNPFPVMITLKVSGDYQRLDDIAIKPQENTVKNAKNIIHDTID